VIRSKTDGVTYLKISIMKASTLKTVLVMLATLLFVTHIFGQDLVGIRVDIKGSRFADQMWLFQDSTCTRSFDNGWDAYKMFGNSLAPQLFAMEGADNFQIDCVPDMNRTYLGFKTGEDTVYTITFTSQNLNKEYQHLYLIDSVANQTVDIYTSGTQYTFKAQLSSDVEKRFKIVTSLPVTVVVPPVDPVTPVTPAITPETPSVKPLVPTDLHDLRIRIYSVKKSIVIENTTKNNGYLNLINVQSGQFVSTLKYNAEASTTIDVAVPTGVYIVSGMAGTQKITGKIEVR
jgi:hypothetical protein